MWLTMLPSSGKSQTAHQAFKAVKTNPIFTIKYRGSAVFYVELVVDESLRSGHRPGSTSDVNSSRCTVAVSAADVYDHECTEHNVLIRHVVEIANSASKTKFDARQREQLFDDINNWIRAQCAKAATRDHDG